MTTQAVCALLKTDLPKVYNLSAAPHTSISLPYTLLSLNLEHLLLQIGSFYCTQGQWTLTFVSKIIITIKSWYFLALSFHFQLQRSASSDLIFWFNTGCVNWIDSFQNRTTYLRFDLKAIWSGSFAFQLSILLV